jgi:hypothetical protein
MGRVIGWSLGALIVAVAMDFAAAILIDDVLDAAIDPITGGAVVPQPISTVLTAVLVGGSVGGVVGSRVDFRPIVVSVVVVLVYLGLWPLAVVGTGTSGNWLVIGVIVHIGSAAAAARLMSRRRRGSGQPAR